MDRRPSCMFKNKSGSHDSCLGSRVLYNFSSTYQNKISGTSSVCTTTLVSSDMTYYTVRFAGDVAEQDFWTLCPGTYRHQPISRLRCSWAVNLFCDMVMTQHDGLNSIVAPDKRLLPVHGVRNFNKSAAFIQWPAKDVKRWRLFILGWCVPTLSERDWLAHHGLQSHIFVSFADKLRCSNRTAFIWATEHTNSGTWILKVYGGLITPSTPISLKGSQLMFSLGSYSYS